MDHGGPCCLREAAQVPENHRTIKVGKHLQDQLEISSLEECFYGVPPLSPSTQFP